MKKTKFGIGYKRGDLILLPFPFTDLSGVKRRPAFVVSPNWYNESADDLIILAVTSKIPEQISKIEVLIEKHDLAKGTLPKPSVVKISKIFTCYQLLVIKQVCHLKREKTNQILSSLQDFLS